METNEVIGGYKLRTLLHTGQVSQVFEVVEPSSSRHLAMKVLLPEAAQNEEHRASLFYDAEVGQKLAHDNIIKIIKIVRDKYTPFFVMEYFPAGALRVRLMNKETDFIREHGMKIFKQAATAFAYMNANGWVHRDIKPDNMLVNSLGELKVIDFAITKRIPKGWSKWFHRRGKPQGTRSYMSPEQIRDEAIDGRADIYSFGATLYEIVTGRTPFRGKDNQELLNKHLVEKPDNPKVYAPDLTDEFADLVLKMLAKKREDRPQNFHEVLMTLQKIRVWKIRAKPTGK